MTLPVEIVDGHGSANKVKVNGEGEIGVVIHTHPPRDEAVSSFPFSQYFTDDGTSGGTVSMLVNGSTTNVDYYISADATYDLFIKTISVRIADASSTLDKFGGITALTNGVEFFYQNDVLGQVTIQDEIKSNLDFIRLGFSTAGIGDGLSAFKADVSGAGAETYLPVIDLSQTFGFAWGLKLRKKSNDRIGFIIKDDVSSIDGFDIKGFGVQI